MYSIHAVYNSVYVEYVIEGDLKLLSGTVHVCEVLKIHPVTTETLVYD